MACGDGDDEPSEPGVTLKSIAISPATANIAVGATQQFAVNGVYSDGKTKPVKTGVTWTSSSTTVATINTAGLATAVGDGTTTITAAVGKLKATASLTVLTKALTGVQITPASASIGVGTTQQYAATANYNDGTTSDVTATATWASSDAAVATISATGLASGVAAGNTTISATFEGTTGTALLSVTAKTMTKIVVTPATAEIAVGVNQPFVAMAHFNDNTTQVVTTEVTWESSNTKVATIASNGTATGVGAGETTITATHSAGPSGSAKLTVKAVGPTELSVSCTDVKLAAGVTTQCKAVATMDDGSTADVTSQATWKSDKDTVATVSNAGLVTAKGEGKANISAEYQGLSGSVEIEVTAAVLAAIQVTPANAVVALGTTQQYTATGVYSDATTHDITDDVNWISSDLTVATIDGDGLATTLKAGQTTISATLAGVTGTATLTVTGATPTSVVVSPATATTATGGTVQFTAMVHFSDGTQQNLTSAASWSSSNDTIATVVGGLATGVAKGTATITATYSGQSGTASLEVTDATVTSVVVSPASASIHKGGTQQFEAVAHLSDGTNTGVLTTGVTWVSDNTSVVTINADGLATGLAVGSAHIRATYNSVQSALVPITVGNAVPTSLTITPPSAEIAKGTKATFTARATLSDGTVQDVTSAANWSSSNTAVATVDKGVATGVEANANPVTILAEYQTLTATASLTVKAADLTAITISVSNAKVPVGSQITFKAIGSYTDGTSQAISDLVNWNQNPAGRLSFANGGTADSKLATGATVGTTSVTATLNGVTSNALSVEVVPVLLQSISITPAITQNKYVGETVQFNALGHFDDGSSHDITADATLTWVSSHASVTISNGTNKGRATAAAVGSANITARVGAIVSPATQVNVLAQPTIVAIQLEPTSWETSIGGSETFWATQINQDGTSGYLTDGVWTIEDANGAIVTNLSIDLSVPHAAIIVAVSPTTNLPGGVAYVAVAKGLIKTRAPVKVKATTITSIAVNCPAPNTCLPTGVGYLANCTAQATYSDGTTGDVTKTATWSVTTSPGTGVALALPQGEIQIGSTAGTANVFATMGSVTNATPAVLTSRARTISSLSAGGNFSLAMGDYSDRKATATYQALTGCSDNTFDVTKFADWSSSNTAVATVDNSANKGRVQAVASGQASIQASFSGIQNIAIATVSAACIKEIEIQVVEEAPANVTVPIVAMAELSDGSSAPLPVAAGSWGTAPVTNGYLDVGTSDIDITYTYTGSSLCAGVPNTATAKLTIDKDAVLQSVAVEPSTSTITIGGHQDFVASAHFDSGTFNVSRFAVWTHAPAFPLSQAASPSAVPARRFTHTGTVGGSTNVLANYKAMASNPAVLTVSGAAPTAIEVRRADFVPAPVGTNYAYPPNFTVTTVARVKYSDGTEIDNPTCVSWQSSHPGYLNFTNPNAPTATTYSNTTAQTVTITATCGTLSATATVQVIPAVLDEFRFNPDSPVTRPRNTSFPLTVEGRYGTSWWDVSSMVSISNPPSGIASATVVSGKVMVQTGANAGTATISFTKDTITRGYVVNVDTSNCLDSIEFTAPTADPVSLGVNQTVDFQARAHYTNGTTGVLTTGTWTPSLTGDGVLIRTTDSGNTRTFRGVAVGESKVTFTYSGSNVCAGGNTAINTITIERDVNVIQKVASAITIRPEPVSGQSRRRIPRGQDIQLSAWLSFTDPAIPAEDVTESVTWSVTPSSIAGITAGGLLKGNAVGTGEAKAVLGSLTATLGIDVVACGNPALSITSPSAVALPIGQTRDYTASASYTCSGLSASELGPFPVTTLVTWNSSVPASAAFETSAFPNRITAKAAGSTNITAQYNGATSNTIGLSVVAVTLQSLTITSSGPMYVGGERDINVSAVWRAGTTDYNLDPPPALTWVIGDPTAISITATADPKKYILRGLAAVADITYRARHDTINSNTLTVSVANTCINEVRYAVGDRTMPKGISGGLKLECQNSAAPGVWDECPATGTASFVSSDSKVVSVTGATFKVVGAVNEYADITGTYTGTGACTGVTLTDEARITVGSAKVASIVVNGPDAVAKNHTAQYAASATFTGGTGAGTYNIAADAIWTSTNEAVATVSAGVLTSKNVNGTTYLSATFEGISSPLKLVTINDKVPTKITVWADWNLVSENGGPAVPATGADAEYPTGNWKLQLHGTVDYSDGTSDDDPAGVTWVTRGTLLKDVSVTGGLFNTGDTANDALQTVRATYTYNGVTVDDDFTVRMRRSTATSTIVIRNTTNTGAGVASVPLGLTQPYGARLTYGGRYYWFTRNATWASATPSVGTIAQSGSGHAILSTVAVGSTQITASALGAMGALTVSVTNAVPVSIYCMPANLSLSLLGSNKAQLFAFVKNSSGPDTEVTVAAGTSWASSDVLLAEFLSSDPKGMITAKAKGTVYVVPTFTNGTVTLTPSDDDRCEITITD
jgi:uncharacterized protein YjdB